MSRSSESFVMFVYNLPYIERKELCDVLDQHDKWEELGGKYMNFGVSALDRIKHTRNWQRSPTNELLQLWGTQNHTVLELFILLSKMQHYQAMSVLKPLVDPKYHRLIYEGEENFSKIFSKTDNQQQPPSAPVHVSTASSSAPSQSVAGTTSKKTEKDMGIEPHNLNYKTVISPAPMKVSLPPLESKIQNNTPSKVQDLLSPQEVKESNIPSETQRKLSNASSVSSVASESGTPLISYADLEVSTNGWDRQCVLGRGGFGTVYKGIWKNTQVAIKKLESLDAASENMLEVQRQQSLREMKYLNSFRHDNILPLYGFSFAGEAPCLVYQFMENGSLEDRLQCLQGTRPLSWAQRYNIATGIARGLQFLHSLGDKPLIHGDIKSANILLDPRFEPKIGDFGLAREGPAQQYTHVEISKVHGTRPYLPAELLRGKKFSTKVDTYSFGIVLFEVATGLRAYEKSRPQKFLKDFVVNYNESSLDELADPKAGSDDARIASGLLSIGKWCVKQLPSQRPEMIVVHQQLNKMASAIQQAQRAQDLLRQNSLSPSTPYERQLVYDHISQQRRSSVPNSSGLPAATIGSNTSRPVSPHQMIPTVIQPPHQHNNNNHPQISVTPPSRSSQFQNGAISPKVSQMQNDSSPPKQDLSNNGQNSLPEQFRVTETTCVTTPCDVELPLISALGVTTPGESESSEEFDGPVISSLKLSN